MILLVAKNSTSPLDDEPLMNSFHGHHWFWFNPCIFMGILMRAPSPMVLSGVNKVGKIGIRTISLFGKSQSPSPSLCPRLNIVADGSIEVGLNSEGLGDAPQENCEQWELRSWVWAEWSYCLSSLRHVFSATHIICRVATADEGGMCCYLLSTIDKLLQAGRMFLTPIYDYVYKSECA